MAGLTSLKVEKRLLGRQAAEAIRSSIITGVLPPASACSRSNSPSSSR